MTDRFAKISSLLRLTGISALVLLVGAARPAKKVVPVARPTVAVATLKPAAAANPPAELLRDATPAAAVISPSYATPRLRTIRMEVTAYCPCKKCCGANAQGITASGNDVTYNNSRFVAADTDRLPFGTQLIIPGYGGGPVEVIDRGGAIKGNKLDVFYPTHEEALQWGRQFINVTVIE